MTEWKQCRNENCTNGKEGKRAFIAADKPYFLCFKCNKEIKESPKQQNDGPKAEISYNDVKEERKPSLLQKTFVNEDPVKLDETVNAFKANHHVQFSQSDMTTVVVNENQLVHTHKVVVFYE